MKPHEQLMSDYYAARAAQEERAEAYALGYATEAENFFADIEPKITFKGWLQGHRRED